MWYESVNEQIINWIKDFLSNAKYNIDGCVNNIAWDHSQCKSISYTVIPTDDDKKKLEDKLRKLGAFSASSGLYKEEISNLLEHLKGLETEESDRKDNFTVKESCISEVLGSIRRKCNDKKLIDLIDEVLDELKNIHLEDTTLGEFFPHNKEIVIYMEAIKKSCSEDETIDPFDLEDVLAEEVLVHEIFHAIHYDIIRSIDDWIPADEEDLEENKAVKESMADFFAYCYLKEMAKDEDPKRDAYAKAVKDLEKKWNRQKFPSFPYSGARAFINEKGDDNTYGKILLQKLLYQPWDYAFKCIERGLKRGGTKAAYTMLQKLKNPEHYEAIMGIEHLLGIKIDANSFQSEYDPKYLVDIYNQIAVYRNVKIPKDLKDEFNKLFYSKRIIETIQFIDKIRNQ